ncbi:MAG: transcription-repair coupling factor [Chlamydiia bacterium]|nr:transcription-repair coupling factor [Chlamydiia bacterium]
MKFSEKSPALRAFCKALEEGESLLLEGLWDAPKAYLASLALSITKKSIVLITGGVREDRLFNDLSFFAPNAVIEFPAWETLPGEEIAPSPDILGKRFEALNLLTQKKTPSILLCPFSSLLQKIVPKEFLAPLLTLWKIGTAIPFHQLPQILSNLGYERVPIVTDKGQFALRGGILDLFPVSSPDPCRLEFFDDTIEQIRTFDPVGQKTIGKTNQIFLSPAKELPLLQQAPRLASLFDYLEHTPLLFWDDLVAIEDTYVSIKQMPGAKSPFFYPPEELLKNRALQHLFCSKENIEALSSVKKLAGRTKLFSPIAFEMLHHSFEATRFFHPFRPIDPLDETLALPHLSAIFLNATEVEEREVKKLLPSLPPQSHFETGILTAGFLISDIPLVLIPNAEITHRTVVRRQKWRGTTHTPAAEFHELGIGDLVVHFHSGIGRYIGMEKHANHLGQQTEFLALEYAEKSKLLVPLSQSYLVSRYIGAHEAPPALSQLGGKRWQATRTSAQAQIVGYASDLLQIYAERAIAGGFRYPADSDMMRQFEQEFPYTATQDQLLAIQACKEDMMSEQSMDRLICGDVGYGKTEVAMRTAFKAVVDGGKQVAVLVPTTVLALQHHESFSQRMRGFPVKIGTVSRFHTAKENRDTLEKVAKREIDILIGTHRILSQDVTFKNLGLVIIDEEQRFGVRAKEHLKKFKKGVDCLTLSATPIPRTLYMSLVHARPMSVISTPPQDRLPVKAIVAETEPELIQNALLRELSRGGQSFFIHNRVETIYGKAADIEKLVPAARIGIVHGQMDADDIDTVFHRFKQGEIDCLFATTLIENGIDIPNANTILIDRADTYGVADLYQLRGRVGRWNRAAYAYFLVPKQRRLPEQSRKRLNALVEAGGYGGGMKIAMRDLEIRGAGDILGVQQSGQVSAIGFHLYCKLLKRAIDALKKQQPISFNETKMEFAFDAVLSESYINELSIRMEIYHRLGEASTFTELEQLFAELKDRFGPPPPSVTWLYHLSRIRAFAAANHFTLLKFSDLSLYAEQQKGKLIEKKTMLLPKKVQTPEGLEPYVLEALQKNFTCSKGKL